MKVIILAAGYGTRLKELGENTPKAFLKIKETTVLDLLIENIEKSGIKEMIIVTNNKFYNNFEDWKKDYKGDMDIKIINDGTNRNEERLGALGDLQLAIEKENINEEILVLGSDNIFKFEIKDVLEDYEKDRCMMNVITEINDIEIVKRMGVVCINENNILTDFEEKPENPKSNFVSTFCYIFPKEKISLIQKYLENENNPEGIIIIGLNYEKEKIRCFISRELWVDIGDVEIYDKVKNGI